MRQNKSALAKQISLVIGILFIPLLYGLSYLQAYWNPYNNVDKLPIAVVNEDSGAIIDGKETNLGNNLVDSLKTENVLDCSFVDEKNANEGVKGNKYYAVIRIPNDFTKDIASATSTTKKSGIIYYSPNQKHSYIAALMLRNAATTIVSNLKGSVNQKITASLVSQLESAPEQLQTLGNGLDQLNSGALSLESGIDRIVDGQNSLTSGIHTFGSGLKTLSSGAAKLSNNMGIFVQALSQANDGAQQLNTGAQGLSSLGTGITSLNSATNQLSTGMDKLFTQFGTGSKTPTLYDSINKLNAGADNVSEEFKSGSTSNLKYLVDRVSNVTSGAPAYIETINSLITVLRLDPNIYYSILSSLESTSVDKRQAYANALVLLTDTYNSTEVNTTISVLSSVGVTSRQVVEEKQNKLENGGASITQAMSVLKNQFSPAASGQDPTLYDGITQLSNGTNQLAAQMSTGTDKSNPTLFDSVSQLASGASQVSSGTSQLLTALPLLSQLQNGASSLSSAMQQINSSSSTLYGGSKTVASGVSSADAGLNSLVTGADKLESSMSSIQQGALKLAGGISSATDGVKSSVESAKSGITATKGLDLYAKNPVQLKETDVDSVSSYGVAFAPFFLSLALWVGALMMFFSIHFDWMKRIKLLTPLTEYTIIRTFAFLVLGAMQAIVLGIIIQHTLALHIANLPLYYSACILFSLVSVSIIQFFIVHLGDTGKLIVVLILILSLTSTGGTFPVETIPKFYGAFYKYMPMTYSIDLMKQAIIQCNSTSAHFDIGIEVGIIILFTGITILLLLLKKQLVKKKPENEDVLDMEESFS